MTMAQEAELAQADLSALAARVTVRQRIAAVLVLALAVAALLTGVLGIGKLHLYQVALDFLATVLLLGTGWLLARHGTRWPAVTVSWLTALGVLAELGDYQSRKNETGALSATNTSYFLPGLLWLYLFLLLVVAIVITSMSVRPKGLHD